MKKLNQSYWARSAFYSFFQRFSLTFFGLISYMIITRMLPSKIDLGNWALFLIITGVFETTKTNLLKNAHIKFVSGSSSIQEKIYVASSSLVINACISLIFSIIILFFASPIAAWLQAGEELAQMLRWFVPGMAFMVFFSHLEAVQQSFLDFKGVFAGYVVRQSLFFIALLIHFILKIPFSLVLLVVYQSISVAIGTIVLYYFSKKYLHFQFLINRKWTKKILGYGGYIFGSGMLANISNNLDQIMIARYVPGSVAYYNIASRVNNLVDIPSYAASEIIFPKTSLAATEEGPERVKYLFEKMVGVLVAVVIPMALFIILFPRFITTIIAGPAYVAAAGILQIYMLSGIIRPAQNQAANLLNSIGQPKTTFILNAISLSILLIVNYFCLKKFGFYGAAIGTLIATCISCVIWYFVMKRKINISLISIGSHIVSTYKTIFLKAKGFALKKNSTANNH